MLAGYGNICQFLFILGCGIWFAVRGQLRYSVPCLLRGSVWLLMGSLILYIERYFIYGIGPLGVYLIFMQLLVINFFESSEDDDAAIFASRVCSSSPFIIGAVATIFGGVVLFVRRRFIIWADGLIHEDLKQYEYAWTDILHREGSVTALTELHRIVNQDSRNAACICPRHHNHKLKLQAYHLQETEEDAVLDQSQEDSMHSCCTSNMISQNGLVSEPVICLDQLLAQALGANPLLCELCQSWAGRSNGYFLWSPGLSFLSYMNHS